MKKALLKTFTSLLFLMLMLTACQTWFPEEAMPASVEFADILNVKNIPEQPRDGNAFCAFDLGSWQGYALPPDSNTSAYGSFSGPFLMNEWRWLSPALLKFTMIDDHKNVAIDLGEANHYQSTYFPGRLYQQLAVDSLLITLNLNHVSAMSALTTVQIANTGKQPRRMRPGWRGEIRMPSMIITREADEVVIRPPANNWQMVLRFAWYHFSTDVETAAGSYRSIFKEGMVIPAGETLDLAMTVSLFETTEERRDQNEFLIKVLASPQTYQQRTADRWQGYLNKILPHPDSGLEEPQYRRLAVKSLLTLMNNWKAPIGALTHEGLIPSYAIHYFNGFWAWDSWKHAVSLARVAPKLAKNQIRGMFSFQDSSGMVADCVFPDSAENNWRDSKPPLAAWAVWEVFQESADTALVAEMFPALMRYHRWWYQKRDHNQNGLCEYGATDGTIVAARWESGMDDAVRFDSTGMLQNGPGAWSMDQESVDLNSYLFAEKKYLSQLARVLNKPDASDSLRDEAGLLRERINRRFFDPRDGYYYDVRLADSSFVRIAGPEGWIPLWAGVAEKYQADAVAKIMLDSTRFATHVPFPTVDAAHPAYNSGYWRGPVWLDQAYFGIRALERYGYAGEARQLMLRLLNNAEGLLETGAPIRENYHPDSGKGLKVNHFSWSAAHLLMLYMGK